MYGYKLFANNEVVSCNRGYSSEEEAKLYAESDERYFNCEDTTIETFEEK